MLQANNKTTYYFIMASNCKRIELIWNFIHKLWNNYDIFLQNPYEHNLRRATIDNKFNFSGTEELTTEAVATHDNALMANSRDSTLLLGNAPDLPPRIDRASKPPNNITPSSTLLTTASARNSMGLNSSSSRNGTYGRTAHEQLFGDTNSPLTTTLGDAAPVYEDEYSTRINPPTDKRGSLNASSLDRKQGNQLLDKSHRSSSNSTTPANGKTNGSSYDSVSSYDSCNVAMQNLRLGPNAPDDLKSVPTVA